MGFRGVSWGFIWCFIWFEPWPWPVLPRMLRNLRVPRSSTTGCETEAAQARLRHANATIAGSDQRKNRAKTVEDVLFDRRTAHLTTIDITISYHILPRGVGLHSSLTLENSLETPSSQASQMCSCCWGAAWPCGESANVVRSRKGRTLGWSSRNPPKISKDT